MSNVVLMINWVNLAFGNRFTIPILYKIIHKGHVFRISSWVWHESIDSHGFVTWYFRFSRKWEWHPMKAVFVMCDTRLKYCLLLTAVWFEAWYSRKSCVTVILSIACPLVSLWLSSQSRKCCLGLSKALWPRHLH